MVVLAAHAFTGKFPSSDLKRRQPNPLVIENHLEINAGNPPARFDADGRRTFSKTNVFAVNPQAAPTDAAMLDTPIDPVATMRPPFPANRTKSKRAARFATWQRWMAEGRYAAARYALNRYLKSHPKDIEAWSLLAECQCRVKRWRAAVRSYRKVLGLSTGARRRQVTFLAGDIASKSGDNVAAAQIFKAYLHKGGDELPMRAEALARLAHAYRKIGLKEESRELERKLVASYDAATLSPRARQMLAAPRESLSDSR
jgi:predicted Zn-dependent protease